MFQWYKHYKKKKAWRKVKASLEQYEEDTSLQQALALARVIDAEDLKSITLWQQSKLEIHVHCLSAHSLIQSLNTALNDYRQGYKFNAPLLLGGPDTVRLDRWCRGGFWDSMDSEYTLYGAFKGASTLLETLEREVSKLDHQPYANRRLERLFITFITVAVLLGETCYG